MPEYLEALLIYNQWACTFISDFVKKIILSNSFAVLFSFINFLLSSLLSQRFPNFDIFFKTFELLQIFLKTFYDVLSQSSFRIIPVLARDSSSFSIPEIQMLEYFFFCNRIVIFALVAIF